MKYANIAIAALALAGIALALLLRFVFPLYSELADYPVLVVIVFGGGVLVARLLIGMFHGEFGSDLLAGISIVTSLVLGEYLAGALVVLMLSGGSALEDFAMRRASSVLDALAKRMPLIAHKRDGARMSDLPVERVQPDDELVVLPHELCPVDGVVLEGHGSMDESYLTGEPYRISKTPGCEVISGAINGETALVIRALREARDSRYVKIMMVMDASRQRRPRIRRLADMLGTVYTPLAVVMAALAWWLSGDSTRFLAVLVVATPCPLIIAIPVAIIGSISWCAKRGIIVKDPIALERAHTCRILITDKTGTLTVGEPTLVSVQTAGVSEAEALQLAASLEQYSKHPLAQPVLDYAKSKKIVMVEVTDVSEVPGRGLTGRVKGRDVTITGRKSIVDTSQLLPFEHSKSGLECIVQCDGAVIAVLRFRDEPRPESRSFVEHLGPQHDFKDIILLSGDRDEEVKYLAQQMNITRVYAGKSPEEKVEIVRRETTHSQTLFLGDGINDAPALTAATVGIAFGPRSDITSEAAGAVILEPALRKVDQFLHISRHMRRVALQSAVGGMALSLVGMAFAGLGFLTPVFGAVTQEVIDLFAVLNALRASSLGRQGSNHI
ncbi:MAG: heavy metal translocating P-type ATPase [Pseudomonadota bacterium]|jgi:heavy metal translocating P-type ATPase